MQEIDIQLNKEFFINKVSKIQETFEDEFKADYNSPELIWDKFLKNANLCLDIKDNTPNDIR